MRRSSRPIAPVREARRRHGGLTDRRDGGGALRQDGALRQGGALQHLRLISPQRPAQRRQVERVLQAQRRRHLPLRRPAGQGR